MEHTKKYGASAIIAGEELIETAGKAIAEDVDEAIWEELNKKNMKTIKEINEDERLKCTIGMRLYEQALKDVLGLIDEITKPKFTCIPICRDLIKELKAKIEG